MSTGNHLARAEILHQQRRFAQSEQELRQALALDPQDAAAHTRLSFCLWEQNRLKEALSEARLAIGLDPEMPATHFALARALSRQDRYKESRAAIVEAFRLGANEACYFGHLAVIEMHGKNWQAVREAAERGLALDPKDAGCRFARVRALLRLGRPREASQAAKDALADAPDTAMAHMNWGWLLLEQHEPEAAIEHFQEALRINPELESARSSLVHALTARYRAYRLLLGLCQWMSAMAKHPGWILFFLAVIVQPQLHGRNDGTAVGLNLLSLAAALYVGYALFLCLSRTIQPLFHGVLLTTRAGRYALSEQQQTVARWVCALLTVGLLCGAVAVVSGSRLAVLGTLTFGATAALAAGMDTLRDRRSKQVTLALTILGGCFGLTASMLLVAMRLQLVDEIVSPTMLTTVLILALAATLVTARHFAIVTRTITGRT